MGRKGMKGFMKSASKAPGPSADGDGVEPEPEQPAATTASSSSTKKEAAPKAAAPAAPSRAAEPSSASAFELEDPDAGPETRGQMLQRHKREMLAHKKAVQKLGKSKKDEAAKLSKRFDERHERELKELDARDAAEAAAAGPGSAAAAAAKQDALAASASKYVKSLAVDGDDGAEEGADGQQQKRTKAQKRKEKHAARDAEREARIAAELEALGPSEKEAEEKALKALLAPLGLAIKEIRADGHCMYRSLEDQLQQRQLARQQQEEEEEEEEQQQGGSADALSYQQLRVAAGAYMRAHRDEFEPYMEEQEDGEGGDDDPDARFERYCAAVEGTAAWGGHLELKALAGALQRQIQVLAVGMEDVKLGEEFAGNGTLQVCYLRHAYGLGEHYNSVKPSVLAGMGESEEQDQAEEHSENGEAEKEAEEEQ